MQLPPSTLVTSGTAHKLLLGFDKEQKVIFIGMLVLTRGLQGIILLGQIES